MSDIENRAGSSMSNLRSIIGSSIGNSIMLYREYYME